MVNTMTGRYLASLTASRRERLEPTRLRAAAALFRRLLIPLTLIAPSRRFRSTTARGRTSSRRTSGSRRRLGLGNRLAQRPRHRGADRARAVLVVLVARVARVVLAAPAAAEAVPAAVVVDVAVPVVADRWVALAEAAVRANATILPLASRYSTSSTTLTCRRPMEL